MRFLSVVQHTDAEWLGHLEDHFEGRGIRFGYSRPFASGGQIPDVATVGDGLVLLGGGSWGAVSPAHRLPTLDAEVRLARACLMMDKAVIGIGLGAQILAIAADGDAEVAPLTFQVDQASRIADSALDGLLPAVFPTVVYMRDRPLPPAYARVLARHTDQKPALFQIGQRAFGFTGHPGVRGAMLEELVMADAAAPVDAAMTLAAARQIATAVEDALVPIMGGLLRISGLEAG